MNLAIFDIDGTLTRSFGFDVHFFEALARRAGAPDPNRPLGNRKNVADECILHESFGTGRRVSGNSSRNDRATASRAHSDGAIRARCVAGSTTAELPGTKFTS